MFRNGLVFRIIGAVLLIVLVAAGGFMAYRAGVAQGVIQAPAVATAISKAAESGHAAPVPPMMYGHDYGYHFGFSPFGAICGSIIFLFLFFGAIKMIFFHGMMHRSLEGHKHHGHWGRYWENSVSPLFEEWHKRAHGEPVEEKKADESKKE